MLIADAMPLFYARDDADMIFRRCARADADAMFTRARCSTLSLMMLICRCCHARCVIFAADAAC